MGGGKKVLVVDDDDAIRRLLHELLADAGYEVEFARSGNEALARAARIRPDVILLDNLMPDGDGTMFATAYGKTPEPRAPIVACAANNATEWGAKIGAAASVQKPFDIDHLLETVERLAARRTGS